MNAEAEFFSFSEPKSFTIKYEITRFKAVIISVILHHSAMVDVSFYDAERDYPVAHRPVLLQGEDYEKWGADDDYINQYIIANMDTILSNPIS
jgi:hypothetical protein